MTRKPRLFLALLAAAAISASCGSSDGGEPGAEDESPGGAASFEQPFRDVEAYPVIVNSEITVGENRILMGLLDDSDAPIGSPAIDLRVRYFDLEASTEEPVAEDEPQFVWSLKGSVGVYVGRAEFDHPGKWGAEVAISGDGLDETVRTSFEVREEGTTPEVGARVPASDTPTAGEVKSLEEISTDPDPDPRFYQVSIAEALKRGRPFVVTFATPKFCQTAVCGPTLDVVQRVARGFPAVTFIHVEPYELPAEPPEFKVVPAVEEWGLPSEPWVFVVDGRGRLTHKYEGVVGADELRAALESL